MTDFSSKGDQSRAEILDAARRLFLSQGYHGTSMRAIARAAGDRAVAGLYNHFPTKEAIFRALIEETNPYDELFGVLEPAFARAPSGEDFLRVVLRSVLRIMPRHFEFIQLAEIDLREFGGANIGHVLQEEVFPRVLALIAHLETLPGFKPIEGAVLLRLMASLVLGYILTQQLAVQAVFGERTPEAWADHFADVLLYGLLDDSARGTARS